MSVAIWCCSTLLVSNDSRGWTRASESSEGENLISKVIISAGMEKKEASVNDKTAVDHQKSQLELDGDRPGKKKKKERKEKRKNCSEGINLKGK